MISSNIRYLRAKENLTQEEFAERFGVSRQSVAKWESGDSTPDIAKCREICGYYEISLDTLVGVPLSEQNVSVQRKIHLRNDQGRGERSDSHPQARA